MCTAADVKNDDGDKVSMGFCLLDIAKHATNTFISSLEDDDFVAVVAYALATHLPRTCHTLATHLPRTYHALPGMGRLQRCK